ncbi:Fur family transcriptional regulator [Halarcobacter bivalviorum]|uniref:Fur family transcriptional regulator n=1 Tax=Halarcobacter bivalviorum TaxID=663364 RepID=UPI00100ABD3C|nr:Fur family transcriptional regulator [Halarcobacter bivalviorum]RXK06466.1 transcriptional repressor [Halarcobacter bivalviorum]
MIKNDNILKNHKLKVTPQRLYLLELLNINGHMTIEELFDELKAVYDNISLATIYKNINLFLEVGLLLEVKINEQKNFYELEKERHSHMFCKNCSSLNDIVISSNSLEQEVSDKNSFNVITSDITFYGLCNACQ